MFYSVFIPYLIIWFAPILFALIFSLKKNESVKTNECTDTVSIIIAAKNEEATILKRLENIKSAYIRPIKQVIVISDGSTDKTVDLVKDWKRENKLNFDLDVIVLTHSGGRANAHNIAVQHVTSKLILFTDAETEFVDQNSLARGHGHFCRQEVGFVSGKLIDTHQSSDTHKTGNLYWAYEYLIRRLQTKAGIYSLGSGALCIVRRKLFQKLPDYGDVDFNTPIDVVLQGYLCIHDDEFIAYEKLSENFGSEYRNRVRMTSKNLLGTLDYFPKILKTHPIISLNIIFHKILRWVSSLLYFLIVLWILSGIFFYSKVTLLCLFCAVIFLRKPLISFTVVNFSFLHGILRVIINTVPSKY